MKGFPIWSKVGGGVFDFLPGLPTIYAKSTSSAHQYAQRPTLRGIPCPGYWDIFFSADNGWGAQWAPKSAWGFPIVILACRVRRAPARANPFSTVPTIGTY